MPDRLKEHRGLDHKGVMRACIQEVHFCWGSDDDFALERAKISDGAMLMTPLRLTQEIVPPMPNQATCSAPDCNKPRQHGLWCYRCYSARQGTLKLEPMEAFWRKVNKDGPIPAFRPDLGACWIWTGSISPAGYGKLTRGVKQITAHRYSYNMLVAPVAEGLDVDHLCRVRACVNPSHLEPVTRKENARRGAMGQLKTHCPHGHEYTDRNTYLTKRGYRQCRRCHVARVTQAQRAARTR